MSILKHDLSRISYFHFSKKQLPKIAILCDLLVQYYLTNGLLINLNPSFH